jgi:hypothetical protein
MLRVQPTCIALALLTAGCRPAAERLEETAVETTPAPTRRGDYAPPKERDSVPYERLSDLCAPFQSDPRAAEAKLKGKVFRFGCTVIAVRDAEGADAPAVLLDAGPAFGHADCRVQCQFAAEQCASLKRLPAGTQLTIQGRYAGLARAGGVVAFVHCSVVSQHDLPLVRAAAADLARAYAQEPTAADRRYQGKVVQFSYALAAVEATGPGRGVRLVFHPVDGKRPLSNGILCQFGPDAAELCELQPGTVLTVRGVCAGLEDETVVLVQCQVVKGP